MPICLDPCTKLSLLPLGILLLVPCAAAQTYHGPVPYQSIADRPTGFLSGSSVVEDLEDDTMDYGIVAAGSVVQPGSITDSVDADDGVIDGFGTDGHSHFGSGPVLITFPAPVRQAGVVWTDGPFGTPVTFEAFGPGMTSLGLTGPFQHADNSHTGGTGEDRLYSVEHAGGIVAIQIHSTGGNQTIEYDHVQYDTLGDNYCQAAPNSTGHTGIQTVIGSAVAGDNDVTLLASRLPRNTFGYFIASLDQGLVPNAGGSQGTLCLGGAVSRFNTGVFNSGIRGFGTLAIDLASIPSPTGATSINAGETWHFQTWHRDQAAGSATSNFTDAVAVQFQ